MADDRESKDLSLDELVEDLHGAARRRRQEASHELAIRAREDAAQLMGIADELVDALERPEAQTRWEALDALSELARVDADKVAGGFDGAEASLFDDDSATVRLSAFRFLTRLGSSAKARSDEAWPLLDEAVQCFHGDPEYRDMLGCLLDFAHGDISAATKKALVERFSFDADSGRDYIKSCSAEIIEAANSKSRKRK